MKKQIILAGLILAASQHAVAEGVGEDLTEDTNKKFSYRAQLRVGIGARKLPLVGFNDAETVEESAETDVSLDVVLGARIQYRGFFIEDFNKDFNASALGYSFYDDERGSFEIIAPLPFGEVERSEVPGFENIEDREGEFNLGLRYSVNYGENIIQAEIVRDVSKAHRGFNTAVRIGRHQQFGNWDLSGFIGARYFSAKVNDHFFSVSDTEASAALPEYQAEDGVVTTIQLNANYPITEKILFNVGAAYTSIPSTVSESPLVQGDAISSANVGLIYVIGER